MKKTDSWVKLLNTINITFGIPGACSYCGETPTELDHVIPRAWFDTAERKGRVTGMGFKTRTCSECNNIIGNKVFSTFSERVVFVTSELNKKYRKKVMSANWTEKELNTLNGTLYKHVKSQNYNKERLALKLDWTYSSDFQRVLESGRLEASFLNSPLKEALESFMAETNPETGVIRQRRKVQPL